MAIDFQKCCTANENEIRFRNKIHFRTYSLLVYSESRKDLDCKYCAIFSTSLMNCGVEKNRQKPGKFVIKPFCYFNKLRSSDGYLYEHDRLECHKSMTIGVRW